MTRRKKTKGEFSKKLVAWSLITTSICICVSYILAFLDHDACSEVTVAVASACIAIAVAYEAKSFGEKNSRNKYGVKVYEQQEDDHGDNGTPLG